MDATVFDFKILLIESHHCESMIPPIQRHIGRMKVAERPRREAGDHLAAHRWFRVLAGLMEVAGQGGGLGFEKESPGSVHRCLNGLPILVAVEDRKSPSQDKTLVGDIFHAAFFEFHDRRKLKLGDVEQLRSLDPHVAHPALVVVAVLPDQANFWEFLPDILKQLADHLELVGCVAFTWVFLEAGEGVEVDRVAVEQDRVDSPFFEVLQGAGDRRHAMEWDMDVGEDSDPLGSFDQERNEFLFIRRGQGHGIVRGPLWSHIFHRGNFQRFLFSDGSSIIADGRPATIKRSPNFRILFVKGLGNRHRGVVRIAIQRFFDEVDADFIDGHKFRRSRCRGGFCFG